MLGVKCLLRHQTVCLPKWLHQLHLFSYTEIHSAMILGLYTQLKMNKYQSLLILQDFFYIMTCVNLCPKVKK